MLVIGAYYLFFGFIVISQLKEKVLLDSNTKGACVTLTGTESRFPILISKETY
jgi:hypothetical protein